MAVYVDMESAQFENVNSLRSYPFSDESVLKDRLGRALSRDILVDVHMVVPSSFSMNSASGHSGSLPVPECELPSACLSSLHISPSMVSACFKSVSGSQSVALSVTVSASNFRPYVPYRLEKLAGTSDAGGVVTFGDFEFPGFPETYFFENAMIHPCCISVADPAKLRKFVDERSGNSVAGDAKISFSGYVNAERHGNSTRLYLEDGAAEELMSECLKTSRSEVCGATPIYSINGVRPDEEGNIVLWFH